MAPAPPSYAPPFTPDVAALATARGMGPFLGTHPAKRVSLVKLIPLVLLGAGFLVGAIASAAAGTWAGLLVFGAIGGVLLFLSFRTPNLNPARAGHKVHVFEQGFIQLTKTGPVDFRWDAIQTVLQAITRRYYNGIYVGTTYRYTITRTDGTVTRLTEFFDQIEKLGQTVAREVTRVQLPRAAAAIQAGQTVYFGELAVNAGGVASAGKGSLPWSDIQEVSIQRGYVSLAKHGKWLPWSNKAAAEIPNLFVFLALAERLATGGRRA